MLLLLRFFSSSGSGSGSKGKVAATAKALLESGTSGFWMESQYKKWLSNPASVDGSWQSYFSHLSAGKPSPVPVDSVGGVGGFGGGVGNTNKEVGSSSISSSSIFAKIPAHIPTAQTIEEHLKVQLLIRAYQVRGHLKAKIDPLQIMQPIRDWSPAPELEMEYYGFGKEDLSKKFYLGKDVLKRLKRSADGSLELGEIISYLNEMYCSSIGFEYTHIPDRSQCNWLRDRIEVHGGLGGTNTANNNTAEQTEERKEKIRLLDRLIWAEGFERFVALKFPGEKRFGLEGAESLIPGLKALIDRAVGEGGVEHIVMGMAHRGRLNVLANVIRKPIEAIFSEFKGISSSPFPAGDVKYHLGMNGQRPTPSGRMVHLSLVANPSHLEAANPLVLGKCRALQFLLGDLQHHQRVLPLLIHGDAAFAGQGVVYESLGLADLPSYTTGGTIHVIINNQIGFTTDPRFSRSTPYCSDVAKMLDAPIIHVNGDEVEEVVRAFKLASDWRQAWKRDVVVDLVCYRRHGHNEIDQPSFTQPRMYKEIARKKNVLQLYESKLLGQGLIDSRTLEDMKSMMWNSLLHGYNESPHYRKNDKDWMTSPWTGFMGPQELKDRLVPPRTTGIPLSSLEWLGHAVTHYPTLPPLKEHPDPLMRSKKDNTSVTLNEEDPSPKNFKIHPGLEKIITRRKESVTSNGSSGREIDMSTAEALALGSLLMEGTHVRFSGQDVERGTFSQRHAVLHSQEDESTWTPLAHMAPGHQAPFTICNSNLSEYGVLGFELGYSLVTPHALVIWEAQFGDFANTAQVIVDQFISSGERKWVQRTGLVVLLPHGYDGAGPEHSNARIDRFLALCDDDPRLPTSSSDATSRQAQDCNMQVVQPTTPSNYFHLLRRQIHRDFRKPLIVFSSKSLLRHPMARSSLSSFAEGSKFIKVIGDDGNLSDGVNNIAATTNTARPKNRIIMCSGQIYYQLHKARTVNELVDDVAIIRIEQISPFPYDQLKEEIERCCPTKETSYVWVQEEPLNIGPWTYVRERIGNCIGSNVLDYVGRAPTAAVATGQKSQHVQEEMQILEEALLGAGSSEFRQRPIHKIGPGGIPIWKRS